MGINLTNLYIDETFPLLVQTSGSVFTDGTGSLLTQVDITASNATSASYALTASYALNTEHVSASHAINADTASLLIGNAEGVGHIDFINTAETTIERRLNWNDTDGTLNIGLKGGNVSLQVGQELVTRVVNKTGADLLEANYKVVKVLGAQGNRLSVNLALADADINSASTLGLVTENIDNNQEGFITTEGLVRGINTTGALQGETWNEGDILYLSGTTPGGLTNVKPITPIHLVTVGYVVAKNPAVGSIFVKINNGYELEELHDVLITSASNGQALVYENGIWVNSDIQHISASYAISSSHALNADNSLIAQAASYAFNAGSASYAVSASYALNADNSISSSYAVSALSSSYSNTSTSASHANVADTSISSSYALTASYAENAGTWDGQYTGSAGISGSLAVQGPISSEMFGTISLTGDNPGINRNIIDSTGADFTVIRSDSGIEIDNRAGSGSVSVFTNGNMQFEPQGALDFYTPTGNINLTGNRGIFTAQDTFNLISNTTQPFQGISLRAPNVRVNLSDTGSTSGDFVIEADGSATNTPKLLLSLGTGSYGSNPTTANMLFTGDDAFFSAIGNFYIKNVFNDTGSIQVWSENALTLRGDTYVKITGDEFAGQTVPVDIQGEAFAYTISSNINGFSNQVNNLSKVRNYQRAYVETPLIVGSQGTIEVGSNSTLKVINEL